MGNDPQPQLYDLKKDLGERHNVADQYPKSAEELAALLKKIRDQGRSRP